MNMRTAKKVEEHVLDEFLTTHLPVTVIKLHELTGLSKTHLRNLVRRNRHLQRTMGFHRIYAIDEPHKVHQTREVEAYVPRREWLAELYSVSRSKLAYYQSSRMRL